jgi:hypothetical protein
MGHPHLDDDGVIVDRDDLEFKILGMLVAADGVGGAAVVVVVPVRRMPIQSPWKLEPAGRVATVKEMLKGRPEDVQLAAVVFALASLWSSTSL